MMHARSAGRLCPLFLAAALAASGHTAQAQDTEPAEPPPCSSAPYRAFDFWIGDWTVTADGKEAGRNRIERILGGCALLESWTGAGESRGHSLNFYDAAQQTWHQTWIDNSGGPLYLSGGLENGTMVLSGQRPPRPGSESTAPTLHRITWTPLPDGKVRQHWEASRDEGGTWRTLFDGMYARQPTSE